MSHEIRYFDYPENCNRKAVQAECNYLAAMDDWQEGCSGLCRDIRWLDNVPIYESYYEAFKTIDKLEKGDYDQLAVRYYDNPPAESSKGLQKAYGAVNAARANYNILKQRTDAMFWNRKSEFVGCKECGSKLRVSLLKKTNCPLCGRNLLSETDTDRLMKAHDKIVEAQKKAKEAEKKDQARTQAKAKNRKVRWLVKIEYHT